MATSASPDCVTNFQAAWTPQVYSSNIEHGYPNGGAVLAASTPLTGYTLVNATNTTMLSWTSPNDGQIHRLTLVFILHVTSSETGGAIAFNSFVPDGTAIGAVPVSAGGVVTGFGQFQREQLVGPNVTSTVVQTTALTVGAAVAWAQFWVA